MNKPRVGEPCNGCGICCMNRVCMNGSYVLGLVRTLGEYADGKCPALMLKNDGTGVCGIIVTPNKYIKKSSYKAAILSKYFAHLIGAGCGCDELFENDTILEEDKLNELLEQKKNDPEWLKKTKLAFKIIYGIEI
ncbi:hypothetical protein EZS27_003569 [termite gut metagenome]|uniref:4Fe-4S ferredoxin-type domain-containing protein n=1 Tax=termite gut metagenome TaxID=433724 RepID=A0A5J4SS07_9ZZZZ